MKRFAYTIGLDLGVSSIGWSVIEVKKSKNSFYPTRLINAGVRLFDRAIQENKDSPAVERRLKRSVRRSLRRRRFRLYSMKKLLSSIGLIGSNTELSNEPNIWKYRYLSLDQKLEDEELAKVILHITKRRGFKSNRKNVSLEGSTEGGVFAEYISKNKEVLAKYRSVGEMFYLDPNYENQKRNRRGNYK